MDDLLSVRENRSLRRIRTAITWVLVAGLFPGLGACAPKRVLPSGEVVHGDEAVTAAGADGRAADREADSTQATERGSEDSGLPDPEFRGRAGTPVTGSTPSNVRVGLRAATLAQDQIGKPYQWGGSGPDKFDCSGLVQYVYGNLGIDLPRVSREQATVGEEVPRSELQPGDLLFFATSGSDVNHVGIYVGRSDFVHAPRRHLPVRTDSMDNAWWRQRFRGARRVQ